jgi:hypothetical protein
LSSLTGKHLNSLPGKFWNEKLDLPNSPCISFTNEKDEDEMLEILFGYLTLYAKMEADVEKRWKKESHTVDGEGEVEGGSADEMEGSEADEDKERSILSKAEKIVGKGSIPTAYFCHNEESLVEGLSHLPPLWREVMFRMMFRLVTMTLYQEENDKLHSHKQYKYLRSRCLSQQAMVPERLPCSMPELEQWRRETSNNGLRSYIMTCGENRGRSGIRKAPVDSVGKFVTIQCKSEALTDL